MKETSRRQAMRLGVTSSGGVPSRAEDPRSLGKPLSGYGERSRFVKAARARRQSRTPEAGSSSTPLAELYGIITPSAPHYERRHSGVYHEILARLFFKRSKIPMIRSALLFTAIGLCAAGGAAGQQKKQPLSPPAETSVTIAGKTITIKYSAPSMRGRKIFGGLEPYGKVWRAGANAATALHTEADLDLNGLAVPKGDYTLFVWLDENQWQLIVNKQTGQWGTNYDQSQDLGRVKMTMSKPPSPIETYKMTLSSTGGNSGKLQLEWENTIASVSFKVK